MHGGYYGEDGQWRVCKSKRRNEESFNTAFRINERELRVSLDLPLEHCLDTILVGIMSFCRWCFVVLCSHTILKEACIPLYFGIAG